MEESEPSRLQGAFRNYIRTGDAVYPDTTEIEIKRARCICIFKNVALFANAAISLTLMVVYSSREDFLTNVAIIVGVGVGVTLLLVSRMIPFRSIFESLGRFFCCPWISCPKVSRENASFQHAAMQEATDIQTVAEEPTASSFVLNKYLPSRRLFHLGRIFHCPSSCCSTVSTEDLKILSEDNVAHDPNTEQDTYQPVIRQNQVEELAFHPGVLQATSEGCVSDRLLTTEKQLLQYLLGNTE